MGEGCYEEEGGEKQGKRRSEEKANLSLTLEKKIAFGNRSGSCKYTLSTPTAERSACVRASYLAVVKDLKDGL